MVFLGNWSRGRRYGYNMLGCRGTKPVYLGYVAVYRDHFVSFSSSGEWITERRFERYIHRWVWVRVATAYVRNPEHQKKELTNEELNRRLWRQRFNRDRRKPYPRGPRRWVKKRCTSFNRNWVKDRLRKGLDEDIHAKYGQMKFGYWD
jgi:hypothetical protein